jgi:transposase, IS6 family
MFSIGYGHHCISSHRPFYYPFHTAQRTIQGYETMHMLYKGQIEGMAKRDVLAQNRVINRMFGLAA